MAFRNENLCKIYKSVDKNVEHNYLKRKFYPISGMFWLFLNADYDFEEVLKFFFF